MSLYYEQVTCLCTMSRPRIVLAHSHSTLQLACNICKWGRPKSFQQLCPYGATKLLLKSLRYDYIGSGGLLFHIFATRQVIMRNKVLVNVSCAFQRNKNAITGEI